MNKYIKFPESSAARQVISQRFYIKYGIPGVIGCIDGSHFKIVVPPREEEHLYYSRKHCHSLNVQMVCDDEYHILSVNPKFGGANHDAFIWENSNLNMYVQNLHQNGEMVWLLGEPMLNQIHQKQIITKSIKELGYLLKILFQD